MKPRFLHPKEVDDIPLASCYLYTFVDIKLFLAYF